MLNLLLHLFALVYLPSVSQLDDSRYVVRERASLRLSADPLSVPAALHALQCSPSPEVRSRCRTVLRRHLHAMTAWAGRDDGRAVVYLAFTGRCVLSDASEDAARAARVCGLIDASEWWGYFDVSVLEHRAIGEPLWWDWNFPKFHNRRPLFAWLWNAAY